MQFADRNFKLACIDALFIAGHIPDPYTEFDDQDSVDDRIERLSRFSLTPQLLSQIDILAPDGGDDLYLNVDPGIAAENEDLYISNFRDLKLLPSLSSLSVHAVTRQNALDLSILLECRNLKKLSAYRFYVLDSPRSDSIIIELQARGVVVDVS